MKKIGLAIIAVVGLCFGAQAQLEKGNFMLGGTGFGNAGFGSSIASGGLSLSPTAGYFVKDNWLAGLRVNTRASYYNKNWNFGISPEVFTRYYLSMSEKSAIFGEARFTQNWSTFNDYHTSAGASIGYNRFITKNVAFETSLGYDVLLRDPSFGNVNAQVGLQFYFGRDK